MNLSIAPCFDPASRQCAFDRPCPPRVNRSSSADSLCRGLALTLHWMLAGYSEHLGLREKPSEYYLHQDVSLNCHDVRSPMCSNYRPVTRTDRMLTFFGVERGRDEPTAEVFPSGLAPMIRLAPDDGTVSGGRLALADAIFRFVPDFIAKVEWARRTYNARSETVAVKPSFRNAGGTVSAASFQPKRFLNPTTRRAKRCAGISSSQARYQWGLPAFTAHGRRRTATTCSRWRCSPSMRTTIRS
jgi:hypothetical protein